VPRPDTHALHIMPSKFRDQVNGRKGPVQTMKSTNLVACCISNISTIPKSTVTFFHAVSTATLIAQPALTLQSSQAHPGLGPSALFAASHSPISPPPPRSPSRRPIFSLSPPALPFSTHNLDMNTSTTRAPTIHPRQTCSQPDSSSRSIQPTSIRRTKSARRRPSR
jgi:hypothetical protein